MAAFNQSPVPIAAPPPARASTAAPFSPSTIARVANWTPDCPVDPFEPCSASLTPDKVIGAGICQAIQFLIPGWKEYLDRGHEDPVLVDAFTQAFALTVRRCPTQLEPCVRQLVEHASAISLTPDTCVRLSHIISDLGSKDIATLLVSKARALPNLPRAFFLSLLRLATEALSPPDMDLALDVSEQMSRKGYSHCTMSLRLLLTGISRMPVPPIATALRIAKVKLNSRDCGSQCKVPNCFINTLFNILDTAVGDDATSAADFIQSLQPSIVNACIGNVCPYIPCLTRRGCFNCCDSSATYILADPLTIDFANVVDVPEDAFVVFLYSSLRQLELRSTNLCTSSPFHKKVSDVKKFLSTVQRSCVIPYSCELGLRRDVDTTVSPTGPATPQERVMLFVALMKSVHSCNNILLLTGDTTLIKDAAVMGVPARATVSPVQSDPQLNSGPAVHDPYLPPTASAAPPRLHSRPG